tara:strand:- start:2109 stop:2777 length:669 start_codon:yes stop_codon:yes gene_type:complete
MERQAISYIRASTNPELQANSVNIQTAIIDAFCKTHGYSLEHTFIEYQSGADDDRVQFNAALNYAVSQGCTLITWKVDRLSRSMSIFSRIQEHLSLLRFAELGDTEPNVMVLGVLLGVAYQERLNTSVRVKACYKTMKAENPDLKWGNPNILKDAQPLGLKVRQSNAREFNMRIKGMVTDFKAAGYCTLPELALRLNEYGVTTRRGNSFTPQNLRRVLNYRG